MKTEEAIKRAGSAKALSELLNITQSAISQWGDTVPFSRVWQLKVLRPEWFVEPSLQPAERRIKQRRSGIDRRKGA